MPLDICKTYNNDFVSKYSGCNTRGTVKNAYRSDMKMENIWNKEAFLDRKRFFFLKLFANRKINFF